MNRFKLVTILFTQLHQRRHVDLVKRRQHCCLLRCAQQTLGDPRAHARHRHTLFHALTGWPFNRGWFRYWLLTPGNGLRGIHLTRGLMTFQIIQHVFLQQAATLTRRADILGRKTVLIKQSADGGTHRNGVTGGPLG